MGGHKAGDYASRYTVETLEKLIRESTLSEPAAIIESAVKQANTMLLEEANNHEEMKGMGTTLVICTIHDNVLTVANVGRQQTICSKSGNQTDYERPFAGRRNGADG